MYDKKRCIIIIYNERSEFFVLNKIIIKVLNPKGNAWNAPIAFAKAKYYNRDLLVEGEWYNLYANQGFPISGQKLRIDNFSGKMVYYFEVNCEDISN
jgi:hypothetical protein